MLSETAKTEISEHKKGLFIERDHDEVKLESRTESRRHICTDYNTVVCRKMCNEGVYYKYLEVPKQITDDMDNIIFTALNNY